VAGSIIWGTENVKALKGSALTASRRPMVALAPAAEGHRQRSGLQRRFEVRCAGCRYGGVVERSPDRCPMCGGSDWETVDTPNSQSPSWAVER
jgi:hypothetical protein